ncbi:unnamed protein product [Diatraea saccharalis]|uniref:Uncharacterized protein n=1 Tax=Diatraea saccharalis TaxID=40085 RepID=A0A9N9R3M9_9NEOP|nr:unnamed protein product [Diatraea saccharalis]
MDPWGSEVKAAVVESKFEDDFTSLSQNFVKLSDSAEYLAILENDGWTQESVHFPDGSGVALPVQYAAAAEWHRSGYRTRLDVSNQGPHGTSAQ